MSNDMKVAYVGDLQIPYQDDRAVALWFKVMKAWKPDAIAVVGDIDDFLEFSSFSDGTTDEFFNRIAKQAKAKEDPIEESPMPYVLQVSDPARKFYTKIRKQHPNADIFAALGNHESRVFKYIDKKAPKYIDETTPENLWDFANLGIDYIYYEDKPKLWHGGVHVHHGNTVSSTGALAVRKDIDNYGISLVRGHSHNGGVVYMSFPVADRVLQGMETGHLCSPEAYGLRYTTNPTWEMGFGISRIVDGHPHLQFVPITSDYVCILDGKIFRG